MQIEIEAFLFSNFLYLIFQVICLSCLFWLLQLDIGRMATNRKQHLVHYWWLKLSHCLQWILLWEKNSHLWVVSILYILILRTKTIEKQHHWLWSKLVHCWRWILLLSVTFSQVLIASLLICLTLWRTRTIGKQHHCWWSKLPHCSHWILLSGSCCFGRLLQARLEGSRIWAQVEIWIQLDHW